MADEHTVATASASMGATARVCTGSWTQAGPSVARPFLAQSTRSSSPKSMSAPADASCWQMLWASPALFCTSAAIACPAARTCSKQPTARETWLPAPERAACCSNVRSVVHTSVGADAQRRHLQQQASVTHGSGQPAITHVAPYFSQLRTAVTGGSQLTLDTHLIS